MNQYPGVILRISAGVSAETFTGHFSISASPSQSGSDDVFLPVVNSGTEANRKDVVF